MDQRTIKELDRRSGAVCDAEDVLDALQELHSGVDIEHEEELWNMVSDVKNDMRIVLGILKKRKVEAEGAALFQKLGWSSEAGEFS
jgi:hypothetical protein